MLESLSETRSRIALYALRVVHVFSTLWILSACGVQDGSGGSEAVAGGGQDPAHYKLDGDSRYSIKVYVPDEAGEYELVELSPQNSAYSLDRPDKPSSTASSPKDEGNDSSSFGQKGQRIRVEDQEGDVYQDPVRPPSQLAAWAYGRCGEEWRSTMESSSVRWPLKAGGFSSGEYPLEGLAPNGVPKWSTSPSQSFYWKAYYVAAIEYDYQGSDHDKGSSTADWSCDAILALQSPPVSEKLPPELT